MVHTAEVNHGDFKEEAKREGKMAAFALLHSFSPLSANNIYYEEVYLLYCKKTANSKILSQHKTVMQIRLGTKKRLK